MNTPLLGLPGDGLINKAISATRAALRGLSLVLSIPWRAVQLVDGVLAFMLLSRRMRTRTVFEAHESRLLEPTEPAGFRPNGDRFVEERGIFSGAAPPTLNNGIDKDIDPDADEPLTEALDIIANESDCFLLVLRLGDSDYHPDDRPDGRREFGVLTQTDDGEPDEQLRQAVQRWLDGWATHGDTLPIEPTEVVEP